MNPSFLQFCSLGTILTGTLLLIFSIIRYHETLNYMKEQNYEKKVFNHWIYKASFCMILFFLFGYIIVTIRLSLQSYETMDSIVAVIFLFGALFVLCMVKTQSIMAHTISKKTTETIFAMIDAMEAKDIYTKGHSVHVLKLTELFYSYLPAELQSTVNIKKLKDAALLHDIGKIGIPDNILNKVGRLTDEEYNIIQRHPKNGKAILENTCYKEISDWILYHHERMDGNGYYGLPGNQIPLESKILSIADTFSALYTNRVYRKKFSFQKAMDIIKESGGTQHDQVLVDAFCSIRQNEIDQVTDSIQMEEKQNEEPFYSQ